MFSILQIVLWVNTFYFANSEVCEVETVCNDQFQRCYQYMPNPTTFDQAQEACFSLGGNLISIQNTEENDSVQKLAASVFTRTPSADFWIGAKEVGGIWEWTDKSQWKFSNWFAAGEPRKQLGSMLKTTGYWRSGAETDVKPYVCAMPQNSQTHLLAKTTCATCPTCPIIDQCDNGWTYFDETKFCYMVAHLPYTFPNAEKYCQQNGGHLVSIHSQTENDFVSELAGTGIPADYTIPQTYIGLQKINNKWGWTDNTEANYFNWAPHNPNNVGGHQYAGQIFPDGGGTPDYPPKSWDDVNGAHTIKSFVCKKMANV